MKNNIKYPSINPFEITAYYNESNIGENINDSHIHNKCEIYINLSGDITFAVENKIYPISHGNIIITRPYEYHHCINHSKEIHKHFCIYFSCEGNENLLKAFFDRNLGQDNLRILPENKTMDFIDLCNQLILAKDQDQLQQYVTFLNILLLIENSKVFKNNNGNYNYIESAIEFISENISQPITIKEIAAHCHISINTLEKHFIGHIGMTPKKFLQKKRLWNAIVLMLNGANVSEACINSGFSNFSSFTRLFKKNFKLTPMQYKKEMFNK